MKFGGRQRIAAVAVAGAVLVAAGCGGGGGGGGTLSKSEYSKKLAAVGQGVQGLSSVSTTGGSPSAQFAKLRKGLRDAADKLAKVNPPSDAKADNDKIVQGLRQIADDLAPLEQAAKDKNAAALSAALSNLQKSGGVKKLQEAITDLKAKGYNGTA